jgi:hypothetical protein
MDRQTNRQTHSDGSTELIAENKEVVHSVFPNHSRARLKRHRFMGHPVYNVTHSVVQINSSMLT